MRKSKARPRRKAKKKGPTIIQKMCTRHSTAIGGFMIVIDPSSGSDESQPGYAMFESGHLIEHGTIEIGTKRSSSLGNRLHMLKCFLEEEFQEPDVIVVERCPFNYANSSAAKLQQVMGVVKSIWDVPVIEVSPASWKKRIPLIEQLGLTYEKSDAMDAVAMGVCCLALSGMIEDVK
jgi:Holliday junction resolvasome RuvABC endonuclease subunit